ncbi:hypothetical protein AB0M79_28205 [Polymorphospora sp. NPDC051019]|uniref:hypothetical protein n=1 Tax=Polymorphospora sp. NPDC051019 TaxID=3155725 RepID=UPI0034484F98
MTDPFATSEHHGEPHQPPPGEPASRDASLPADVAYRDFLRVDLTDGPPVPISVWRAVPRDGDDEESFRRRLARRIVVTFSQRDTTVVDFDGDPAIEEATTAAGRLYLPVTHPADLTDVDDVRVDLIVLRWPRPAAAADAVADLFRAFRLVVTPDGFAVLIVDPNQPSGGYPEQTHHLIPAADAGGMAYLQRIIAITVPIALATGDTTSDDDTNSGSSKAGRRTHVDILVFVVAGGHRG